MDIIRPYKSNKNMTEIEKIEHLKQLNRARRNRAYRKKKMEQLKIKQQQAPKITIQKIDWGNNSIEEDKEDSDEEHITTLTELYDYMTQKPNDKEVLEAIDILEDILEIDEDEKLNVNGDFDSSDSSDSDSN
jgi:hypothetical protein